MDRFRVLVVDDSSVSVAAIKLAIIGDPMLHFVGAAGTAIEAVSRCQDLDPDVITLDLDIPGGGGLEALATIKTTIATPVVIVSTSTYEGSRVIAEVLKLGADDVFDKQRVLMDAGTFRLVLRAAAQDRVRPVASAEKRR